MNDPLDHRLAQLDPAPEATGQHVQERVRTMIASRVAAEPRRPRRRVFPTAGATAAAAVGVGAWAWVANRSEERPHVVIALTGPSISTGATTRAGVETILRVHPPLGGSGDTQTLTRDAIALLTRRFSERQISRRTITDLGGGRISVFVEGAREEAQVEFAHPAAEAIFASHSFAVYRSDQVVSRFKTMRGAVADAARRAGAGPARTWYLNFGGIVSPAVPFPPRISGSKPSVLTVGSGYVAISLSKVVGSTSVLEDLPGGGIVVRGEPALSGLDIARVGPHALSGRNSPVFTPTGRARAATLIGRHVVLTIDGAVVVEGIADSIDSTSGPLRIKAADGSKRYLAVYASAESAPVSLEPESSRVVGERPPIAGVPGGPGREKAIASARRVHVPAAFHRRVRGAVRQLNLSVDGTSIAVWLVAIETRFRGVTSTGFNPYLTRSNRPEARAGSYCELTSSFPTLTGRCLDTRIGRDWLRVGRAAPFVHRIAATDGRRRPLKVVALDNGWYVVRIADTAGHAKVTAYDRDNRVVGVVSA